MNMDHHQEATLALIARLPVLTKDDVDVDETCGICLMPFSQCFDAANGDESHPETGVTVLERCGHIFCRKE